MHSYNVGAARGFFYRDLRKLFQWIAAQRVRGKRIERVQKDGVCYVIIEDEKGMFYECVSTCAAAG